MARPLGKYQYYPENLSAPPKPETDDPKPADDEDDDPKPASSGRATVKRD